MKKSIQLVHVLKPLIMKVTLNLPEKLYQNFSKLAEKKICRHYLHNYK